MPSVGVGAVSPSVTLIVVEPALAPVAVALRVTLWVPSTRLSSTPRTVKVALLDADEWLTELGTVGFAGIVARQRHDKIARGGAGPGHGAGGGAAVLGNRGWVDAHAERQRGRRVVVGDVDRR